MQGTNAQGMYAAGHARESINLQIARVQQELEKVNRSLDKLQEIKYDVENNKTRISTAVEGDVARVENLLHANSENDTPSVLHEIQSSHESFSKITNRLRDIDERILAEKLKKRGLTQQLKELNASKQAIGLREWQKAAAEASSMLNGHMPLDRSKPQNHMSPFEWLLQSVTDFVKDLTSCWGERCQKK
jgi:phage shock protein A